MVVLAERLGGIESAATWERESIRDAAPRTIDEMLAREPSFSLYRRQSAVFGNPTSAGVSLRNTGATAASRTLVLLDGVPQNDPFGGWVYWARHDASALESIRITPAARAVVWGSQSPTGVIQMNRRPLFENLHVIKAGAGGQGTHAGSMVHQIADADGGKSFSFAAFGLRSDGFHALDASQRGPIDRKLDIDLWGAESGFAWRAAPGVTIEPRVSWYAEDRGNGTPMARNSTEALDLSLRLTAEHPGFSWQLAAWHQMRDFASVFTSVNTARTAETLALDQYDVPGRGTGGSLVFQRDDGGRWSFMAGADTRFISGETNETVGTFRDREAGGKQDFAGLFGSAAFQADALTTLNMAARFDAWWLHDGRRTEASLADGQILRADALSDRNGSEPSASLEIHRRLGEGVEAWAAAGSGFRMPTLNELHRPFRVRNDIVEANPALDPERVFNLEAGIKWRPEEKLGIELAFFHHWIRDVISNVQVTDPAEIAALVGTLPPGGSLAQRRNVDEAHVTGVEGRVEWQPAEDIRFDLTGVWAETRFSESRTQPLLEGKPFPQSPDMRIIAGGEWRVHERLCLFAGHEYGAAQYDDALAARRIPDYTSTRIGARWMSGRGIYQVRVENLFDAEIQTGLASNGLRTYGAPRSLWLGAEWEF